MGGDLQLPQILLARRPSCSLKVPMTWENSARMAPKNLHCDSIDEPDYRCCEQIQQRFRWQPKQKFTKRAQMYSGYYAKLATTYGMVYKC